MKKCSYCGAEYPDDAVVCAIDQTPLESNNPAPREPQAPEVEPPLSEVDRKVDVPEGFLCVTRVEPFEADRLLKQFTDASIRFQVDRVDTRVSTGRGYRTVGMIDIYVDVDDEEKAMKIVAADWKV